MKLMQRMAAVAARRHLSPRTVEVYQAWVRRFLQFHRVGQAWRHPRELRGPDVATFLTHLAAERRLSASSQNQAMNAVLFVYRDVLGDELGKDHLGPIH